MTRSLFPSFPYHHNCNRRRKQMLTWSVSSYNDRIVEQSNASLPHWEVLTHSLYPWVVTGCKNCSNSRWTLLVSTQQFLFCGTRRSTQIPLQDRLCWVVTKSVCCGLLLTLKSVTTLMNTIYIYPTHFLLRFFLLTLLPLDVKCEVYSIPCINLRDYKEG